MKTLYIEAQKKINEQPDLRQIEKIPGKLHILYSIQYKKLAELIKNQLGNKVIAFSQVLGCSIIKPQASLLLIGSGRFHAINLSFRSGKPVYIYNNSCLDKIQEQEIRNYENKQKAKLSKFLISDKIGLIVSTKPGQNKLQEAIKLKKKLEFKYKNKKFYLFISDNINLQELENFPIDIFINFACPGLELDSNKIINYQKILELI